MTNGLQFNLLHPGSPVPAPAQEALITRIQEKAEAAGLTDGHRFDL